MTSNNTIEVGGRIVSDFSFSHEVYGEGFYRFNLEVDRLSGNADILPVTISERIINREEMTIGIFVRINGQVRSYNSYVEADKKNKLVLTVFVRDISIPEAQPEAKPNDVFLDGFLCKPAIYRTTPFGREIADLLLAVNRSYNKSDYIPCISWGRNARFSGKLSVGDRIKIWGRMQSRIYQKKQPDGSLVEKVAYEISVTKIGVSTDDPTDETKDGDDFDRSSLERPTPAEYNPSSESPAEPQAEPVTESVTPEDNI